MKNRKSDDAVPVHRIPDLIADAEKKRAQIDGNVYRLINGVGDGLPGITLDRFNRHYVLQIFDESLAKRAEYIGKRFLDEVDADYFIIKMRCWSDGLSLEEAPVTVLKGDDPHTTVIENGVSFHIHVNDAINNGLFLDMRANRLLATEDMAGKTLLNGFAYTCSFGAYAKYFGATKTVNVDISQKILDAGKENYHLNGFDGDTESFVRADVIEYLELLKKNGTTFDLVVMDPPSFSRFKGKTFSAKKSLDFIAEMSLHLLTDNGTLFISTNNSSISSQTLKGVVSGCCAQLGYTLKSAQLVGQGVDFPGSGKVRESHLAGVLAKISKNI
ncbi:MAG: class I SAM-dependent methyltransferase [Fibrobacterales bacterium]